MGLPAKINYSKSINVDRRDLGKGDTLRFNVLSHVVEENYDKAIDELKSFLNADSDYPKFRSRSERYILHSVDLVNGIRAKRNFPGMSSLTTAKQQELHEKFKEHFNELTVTLKKVEKIQVDVRMEDFRSTVWVVQAVAYAIIAIAVAAFLLDANAGLFKTIWNVADEIFSDLSSWIFKKL